MMMSGVHVLFLVFLVVAALQDPTPEEVRLATLISQNCGNFNRQLDWFAREYEGETEIILEKGEEGASCDNPKESRAYAVAETLFSRLFGILSEPNNPAFLYANKTAGTCMLMPVDPEKDARHAAFLRLTCVADMDYSLIDLGKNSTIERSRASLDELVRKAIVNLRLIMDCPRKMAQLVPIQLKVEAEHRRMNDAHADGAITTQDLLDFRARWPIPTKKQYLEMIGKKNSE